MDLYRILQGAVYFLMAMLGSVTNFSILFYFCLTSSNKGKALLPEVIMSHIAGSNLVVFVTRALPSSLSAFGFRDLFTDRDCKVILLMYRTCRGAVIGLTCLLSCYQGIVISSSSPKWMYLRTQLQKYLTTIIYVCYLMNMASNLDTVYYAFSISNVTMLQYAYNLKYCFVTYPNKVLFEVMGLLNFVQDLFSVMVMATASGYILLVLYQHKKVVRSLRHPDQQTGRTAESQATTTVITLVTLYLTFYGIENAIWLYQTVSNEILTVVTDVRIFFTMSYSFVFPIVTLAFNPKLRSKMKQLRNRHE
ncbi:hypothetical protein NDU88_004696 [Pleurodeles waltl]|uniref:Vomeronasal type-1 receptor n=2 Tax=Pleurodeles waltl TaxID=8319 RepID=A0AAV7QFA7_PLEWA|nr:hypothetical protein NDU88_004696 [Pleurodeles waltl]